MIQTLANALQRQHEWIEMGGGMRAGDGRWIEVDHSRGIDAKSVLATVVQNFEQLLMSTILEEYEADESRSFRPVLWLHDGCYLHFTESKNNKNKHIENIRSGIAARSEELGVHAILDVETITSPVHS